MPAEGLAFLISAIIEILLLLILFSIFSLKLIKDLFSLIFFFKESYEDVRKFILSGKTHEYLKSLQNV